MRGRVLDVAEDLDREDQRVMMWKLHNAANQQWDIVCTEIAEPKKGELNEDYGLYVERPFYIISALPKGRYLDLVENNLVIKVRNSFPT